VRGGASYKTNRKANCSTNYANTRAWKSANTDGSRYPTTVLRPLKLNAVDRGLHPTQKPLALLEYLIRTYTRPGELILDNCAGSGTTLLAAHNTGRRFVGMERNQKYYWRARRRLAEAIRTCSPLTASPPAPCRASCA
jgi:site-specific DNA-methyltransferase (adenine-specific)